MTYDNTYIPWDKRNYLPSLFLIFRYVDNRLGSQYSTRGDYLYSEVVVSVGRIHFDYQEMFLENINNSLIDFFCSEIYYPRDGSACSDVRLCTYNELTDKQRLEEVRNRKIENLSACIQEVKADLEELEKTLFRDENNAEIQSNIVPVVSDSLVTPASVFADITSIRPYPQIFAQGDEAAPNFDDNGAAGMVVASNTARTADGIVGINKRLDKLIELQQQTVNSTAIISAKMPGRITEIEDIPPYDPTDKRWVPAAEYSKIKEIATKDLDSMRSRGDKDPDSNSGIHGQHIWRAVGDGSKRRIYYLLP